VLSSVLSPHSAWAATRPQYGGTLRVQSRFAPASLDPADLSQGDTVARRAISALIFETLVTVDTRGTLNPALATAWQADPGNQRWKFVLRHDVKFHDGSSLTTEAVAASLREANPTWKIFPEADVIVIERDAPAPNLAAELARPRNAIVKRNVDTLAGTGPFAIRTFSPGKRLTLAANEESWAGRPYVDTIEIDFGKNGRDQLIALDSGRADLADVGPDQAARAATGVRHLLTSQPVELVALVFTRDPQSPEDRALRSALALSIDRVSVRHVILQSSGDATGAMLPEWISGYAFVFPDAQNLALARQKRAELRQAPTLTIAYDPSDSFAQVVAERVVLNAKDAGITLQTTSSATPDLRLVRISVDSADPQLALNQIATQLNLAAPRFANASPEALYEAESTALQTQRVIPLFYLPATYVSGPSVRGLRLTLLGLPDLANTWLGAPAQ
jgi:ABC-type transport system substrate-binding protein